MKYGIASIAVAAAILAPGVSFAADGGRGHSNSGVYINFGSSGVAVAFNQRSWERRRGWYGQPNINRYEAVRIAQRYGLARLHDIDFDDGYWELEGRTQRGARIDLEISAWTGRVVDVDYGWRGQGRRFRGYNRHRNHRGISAHPRFDNDGWRGRRDEHDRWDRDRRNRWDNDDRGRDRRDGDRGDRDRRDNDRDGRGRRGR